MRVYKFGGASIKDAASIKNVANILQQEGTNNCLLVVSAMGKMTNAFENIVNAYFEDEQKIQETILFVTDFHSEIAQNLFPENHKTQK